jgi:hypothetical protein
MKNLRRLAYFTTLPLTGRGGDGLGPGPRRRAGVPAEKGGRRMVLEVNNTLLECTEAARWLLVCASGSYGERWRLKCATCGLTDEGLGAHA